MSRDMSELFGDDEPKINKPRPANKDRQPYKHGEELMQLRGSKGRKQKNQKSIGVNYKEPEPEVKKAEQQQSPNIIKYWNDQTHREEQCVLDEYVQRLYEKDEQIIVTEYPPEDDKGKQKWNIGNIEYKFKLTDATPERLEELTTQMKYRLNAGFGKSRPHEIQGKYRLNEGTGQAFYRIGVQDNGTPTGLNFDYMLSSLKTLYRLSQKLKAEMTIVDVSQGLKGKTCLVMVQKANILGMQLEVKALLFGESSHGKSTLLGVLKTGELDNGDGKARMQVFTSEQELVTGVTQSINHEVIAFDSNGKILSQSGIASWESIINLSTKILTIIDVGGHKKAEKQVISSICSFFPEYAIVVLSALHPKIDPEPMKLAVAYNLAMIIVVTHIDISKEELVRETCCQIRNCLKELCPDKTPTVVKKLEDAVFMSQIVSNEEVIPIFPVSNVTGENLDVLISFLNQLPPLSDLSNNVAMPAEFLISQRFVVKNKTILAGTVIKGHINKGQHMYLGPDAKGNFRSVQIIDIRCLMVNVRYAKCGQTCTVYIIDPHDELGNYFTDIRRGMVLLESKANTNAFKEFQAELRLLPKASDVLISKKCQPVVNTLTTRQICQMVFINNNQLDKVESPQLRAKSSINSKCRRIGKADSGEEESKFTKTQSTLKLRHRKSIEISASFVKKRQEWNQEQAEKETEVPKPELDTIKTDPQSPRVTMNPTSPTIGPTNALLKQLPKAPLLGQIVQERTQKKRKQKQDILLSASTPTSLRLRFKYYPQYITVGQKIIIKQGQFKAVGKITEIYY